jgi:hypothetical protein
MLLLLACCRSAPCNQHSADPACELQECRILHVGFHIGPPPAPRTSRPGRGCGTNLLMNSCCACPQCSWWKKFVGVRRHSIKVSCWLPLTGRLPVTPVALNLWLNHSWSPTGRQWHCRALTAAGPASVHALDDMHVTLSVTCMYDAAHRYPKQAPPPPTQYSCHEVRLRRGATF